LFSFVPQKTNLTLSLLVILGGKYGMPIDMWSLGCILAELYTGFAILPGEDESDQLACIIELLGMPPKQVLENSKRAKIFFNAKGYPRYCTTKTLEDGSVIMSEGFSRRGMARGPPGSRKLKNALNGCDDAYFLQFIHECLEWVPEKRLTPEQGAKHPWFKRRLPKLPQNNGAGGSGGGNSSSNNNSYSGTLNSKQPQSLTASNSNLTSGAVAVVDSSKESFAASTSSAVTNSSNNKGMTASCFYYDNTVHQLPAKGNNQHNNSSSSSMAEDLHNKPMSGNATMRHQHHNQSKLGDLSNRKSLTLNRLMSSSVHSSSTLSLVSSSSHNVSSSSNNNGSSQNIANSKLPSLN